MNIRAELRHVVHISNGLSVDPGDLTEYLVLAPLLVHLELLVEADSRQLLSGGGAERLLA
jgi:hypothetical protein